MVQLVIFSHLPRQLEKHLAGQLHPVIIVLLELNKLHQVPDCFVALEIRHLHVVIVQLMHYSPVVSISNSNHDDTQGQFSAFDQQIFHLFLVMNNSVSHDHQNHVFLLLDLHVLANRHRLPQKRGEVSRS